MKTLWYCLLLTFALTFNANCSQASVSFGIIGASSSQAAAIVAAEGHAVTILPNLSAANLSSVDVVWALNNSNSAQLSSLLTYGSEVSSFVNSGGVLLYHDRQVGNAESVLPGGGSFNIIRDFSDDQNIDVLNNSTLVTNGPGGVVNDFILDNGNRSSHGYTVQSSLPGNSLSILSRTNPAEIVDFTYEFGSGNVYYSTIPLDFYLSRLDGTPFRDIYAPNVVAYSASLADTSGPAVIPEPTAFLVWSGIACCCGLATRRRC